MLLCAAVFTLEVGCVPDEAAEAQRGSGACPGHTAKCTGEAGIQRQAAPASGLSAAQLRSHFVCRANISSEHRSSAQRVPPCGPGEGTGTLERPTPSPCVGMGLS